MRALKYRLTNGKLVSTMYEAINSGLRWEIEMVDVAETPSKLSPIRKAMLKQFGYVSPKLKDKVVL